MTPGIRRISIALFSVILFCFVLVARADSDQDAQFPLQSHLDEPKGMCLDIYGFRDSINLYLPLQAHTCKPDVTRREDQIFRLNHPMVGNIYNPAHDVCVDAVNVVERGPVFARPCTDSRTQKFDWSANGELHPIGSELCIAVSPGPSHPAVPPGRTPEAGETSVARSLAWAPCDAVDPELTRWAVASGEDSK